MILAEGKLLASCFMISLMFTAQHSLHIRYLYSIAFIPNQLKVLPLNVAAPLAAIRHMFVEEF